MKNFSLNDSQIKNYASSMAVYLRGQKYYLENRVKDLRFDAEELTFTAEVSGNASYDVEVIFSQRGDVRDYWCDCPAFSNYDSACKHIVAVLIALQRNLSNTGLNSSNNNDDVAGEIINLFSSIDKQRQKREVNLEISLAAVNPSFGLTASAEFKIGLERLYVLKNIREFLTAIADQRPMEFGKNFVWEPDKHTFKPCDQPLIDFLTEVLALEQASNPYSYYVSNSAFNGKTVRLNDYYMKKFLDVLGERPFSFSYSPGSTVPFTTIHHGLPLSFKVEPAREGLALILDAKEKPVPLNTGGDYFYFLNGVYRASEEQKRHLVPLLKQHLRLHNKIVFPPAYVERFVSEALPSIRNAGRVEIDSALENRFCQEELTAKIYFERTLDSLGDQPGIAAQLELHYGDQIINPFSSVSADKEGQSSKKIIVRDSRKEHKIFDLLEQAGFTVSQGEIHLYDDDRIFGFIENILPELQELAEVFYSEQFKGLRIRTPGSCSGSVRLDKSLDLLEFSLQFDDVDSSELERVFHSLKLKKKYIRLKDGSFLNLQESEMETVATLVEHLGLNTSDLGQEIIHLPKYRAVYIDSFLRQKKLQGIGRNSAFKHLVQSIQEPQDMEYQIPEELEALLREYQKTGFRWLKTLACYGLGGILADDMGLGKTLQVIAFILAEKGLNHLPSLVIAPTSLLYNWEEEVQKFTPSLKVVVISGTINERREKFKEITGADIVVTSYPLIRRDIELYKDIEFAYCFLDEAQQIKNPNTINAKSVQQLKARNYFALTGTPIENSLTELWSIFNFIMPGYLHSHSAFQKKYELPIARGEDPDCAVELSRHVQPFVLRRLKKDVLKELPDKIETRLMAEMTTEQRKIYQVFLKQAKGEIMNEINTTGFDKSRIKILAALTRLRQICCHPGLFIKDYTGESGKMLLLQEVLEGALSSGHRILLFSQFTSMLAIIREYLSGQGTGHFYLDGRTKAAQRQEMVQLFNKGENEVFLISLKAGGTGLNLTGADMVIHVDPWWNPAVEEQATDRAHRIGQKNVVQVFKMITKGTIEEKIFTLQQKKKELIDAVIRPGETFLSRLTEEELKAVFDII